MSDLTRREGEVLVSIAQTMQAARLDLPKNSKVAERLASLAADLALAGRRRGGGQLRMIKGGAA